jgi:hypothetical protein
MLDWFRLQYNKQAFFLVWSLIVKSRHCLLFMFSSLKIDLTLVILVKPLRKQIKKTNYLILKAEWYSMMKALNIVYHA